MPLPRSEAEKKFGRIDGFGNLKVDAAIYNFLKEHPEEVFTVDEINEALYSDPNHERSLEQRRKPTGVVLDYLVIANWVRMFRHRERGYFGVA